MRFSTNFFALFLATTSLFTSAGAYKGDATYFDPGLGACGRVNHAGDLIVALSASRYGNGNHCFKQIGIHYKGKYVRATVVDKCPGCAINDVDISPSAFEHLANKDLGRIKVDWEFI